MLLPHCLPLTCRTTSTIEMYMKDLLFMSPSNTLYSSLIFLEFSWLKTCGCTNKAQADCTSLMADRLMWRRRQPCSCMWHDLDACISRLHSLSKIVHKHAFVLSGVQ